MKSSQTASPQTARAWYPIALDHSTPPSLTIV
jgi:cell cycle arrest protein BUB2